MDKLKNKKERKIITISNNKKISLEEKVKSYNGRNLSKDFKWDKPVGKEIL